MDRLVQDLRYALRSLSRSPGYTAVVVIVMALGIGVNTMVFSMVYGVLFRPLPFPNPDQLAAIKQSAPKRGHDSFDLSVMNFNDFRARSKSFSSMGMWWDHNAIVTFDKDPERLAASTMTPDLIPTLGARPILGRGFQEEEGEFGKNWTTMLISHKVWTERFNSDPNVLGKTLRINGRVRTIIGVMPPDFRWPEVADFFLPMGVDPKDEHRNDFAYQAIGRLKPGVTVAQANTEIQGLMEQIKKEDPTADKDIGAVVLNFREDMASEIRPMMILMMVAVGCVLVIACANVANLMLARAAGRRREIALRMSLGASRGRVMQQLLTESVLVSFLGAVVGVLLAHWGNRMWLAMIPLELPMFLKFDIGVPVLVFTVLITVLSGMVFGLAPAFYATDAKLTEALREGSIQAGSSRGRNRIRQGLVVTEIAIALVMLVGTGLMVRSFMNRVELGKTIRTEGILTANVLLPVATFPEADQRRGFFRSMTAQLLATPGVEAVTMARILPLGRNGWSRPVKTPEMTKVDPALAPLSHFDLVMPGFFEMFNVPLHRGRDFNDSDDEGAPPVVIVTESIARKLWPKGDAIGQRMKFGGEPDTAGWRTVIGICADVQQNIEATDDPATGTIFCPQLQDPNQLMSVVVRSTIAPGAMAARMREVVRGLNSDLAVYDVRTMKEHLRFSLWTGRLFSRLLSTFALMALIIAAVGIYGVMAYSVAQRTQEIGIRMALGADPQAVVRMVVGQAMWLTAIGAGIGLAGAYAVTRLMASMLFGVSPNDPPTFAGVALILGLSAVVAAWVPAVRASKVQPLEALRCE